MSATRTRPQYIRPGNSKCAGLRRKKVTVSVARTATPITAALVPLIPLGRSTAENGRAIGVDCVDDIARFTCYGPAETGAKQRIDDKRGFADRLRIERQHREFPPFRGRCGFSSQIVAVAREHHRDVAASSGEFRRSHEAISTIVAGTGDNHDRDLPSSDRSQPRPPLAPRPA